MCLQLTWKSLSNKDMYIVKYIHIILRQQKIRKKTFTRTIQ